MSATLSSHKRLLADLRGICHRQLDQRYFVDSWRQASEPERRSAGITEDFLREMEPNGERCGECATCNPLRAARQSDGGGR
jgi:hypothetical protein